MDHHSFDDLTRSLARGQTRRGVLRTAAAVVLAAFGSRAAAGDVAADTYAPVPLKTPKTFKKLRGRAESRIPCGSKYCTAEQTCNSTGTGCIPKGGVECGSGYCVAGEQTCVEGGCLPQGSTACGTGRCQDDDFCVEGQAICVDDCPAERTCGGVCCVESDVCNTETGTCVAAGPDPVCPSGGTCGAYASGCNGNDACTCVMTADNADYTTACVSSLSCEGVVECSEFGNEDCPTGYVCAVGSCCGFPVCLPMCAQATE